MGTQLRFCVCGGGSLAHAVAAVLGSNEDVRVNVLTRQPERWGHTVRVLYKDELELSGQVDAVSSYASEVIPDADIIIIAVPSYAREEVLGKIKPFVRESAWVGSFPGFGGFDWQARQILGDKIKIFGSQRVPYVCKKISYGELVSVTGIRPQLFVAALPCTQVAEITALLEDALNIRTVPMGNYLNVSLSLSNPTFHTARLYSLFKDWREGVTYPKRVLFYDDWDEAATKVFGKFDEEIRQVRHTLPVETGYVKSIVQHYEVATLSDVTQKIRSIKALQGREAPLREVPGGYIPDTTAYYFTEDIPYGLLVIKSIAELCAVPTPMMDEVIGWAQNIMGEQYIIDGSVARGAPKRLPIAQNFGINGLDELARRAIA